jgi:hypothetical protein
VCTSACELEVQRELWFVTKQIDDQIAGIHRRGSGPNADTLVIELYEQVVTVDTISNVNLVDAEHAKVLHIETTP